MATNRKIDQVLDDEEQESSGNGTQRKLPRRSSLSGSVHTKLTAADAGVHTLAFPSTQDGHTKSIPFQRPTILTTFSYDPEKKLLRDNSAMRYYIPPPRGADLGHRYKEWVKRPEEKGRLDNLLKVLSDEPWAPERERAGAISWRGVMCKMIVAPYEDRDGWKINVMRIKDTLYFEEHLTEAQLAAKQDMEPRHRQSTYYGYAFESWCTSETPPDRTRPGQWGGDVETNVQWCAVAKTKLGETRLVIGGEVDCVRDRYDQRPDTFVELKTSITIRPRNRGDEERFEKKMLKFYFQSFLLGVPEIVVGFRNARGILQHVQTFQTLELPRLVRGKPNAWDPNVCLQWGDVLLSKIREWTGSLGPHGVGRLVFTPGKGVDYAQLDEVGVEDVQAGEDRVGFLPRWYHVQESFE